MILFPFLKGGHSREIFVTAPSASLDCTLCRKVMKDAVKACSSDIDHYYCRTCLLDHLLRGEKKRPCPALSCKKKCIARNDIQSAGLLNSIIADLDAKCYMNHGEVSDEGPAKKARMSTRSCPTSDNADATSTSGSCNWFGKLKDLDAHIAICQFVEAACSACGLMVKFSCAKDHKELCPKRSVSCPNGCSEAIVFDQLPSHGARCLLEVVDCHWKGLAGCKHRCIKSKMPAHINDAPIHFAGITTKLLEMSQGIEALKVENAALKSEYLQKVTQLEADSATLKADNLQFREKFTLLEVNNATASAENVHHHNVTPLEVRNTYLTTPDSNKVNLATAIEDESVLFQWSILFEPAKAAYKSPEFQAFGHGLLLQLEKNGCDYGLFLHMVSRVSDKLGFKFTIGRYEELDTSSHVKTHTTKALKDYPMKGHWGWGASKLATIDDFTKEKLLNADGTLSVQVVVYKAIPDSI